MRTAIILSALSGLALTAAALAGPRDGATFTNLNSTADGPAGVGTIPITASYPVKFVRIQGTLESIIGNTFAREATLRILPSTNPGQWSLFAPSTGATSFTTVNVDAFFRLPTSVPSGSGAWSVITTESIDDGAGPDARWNTLTVTLNDGPPTNDVMNFGPLAGSISKSRVLPANSVIWYKFELTADVNPIYGTYLDIDTEGSSIAGGIWGNDTEIALYNENGAVVGYDDDDGSGAMAQLTYGAGLRPGAGGDGFAYDGRDGTLPAGTYYLAVRAFSGETVQVGWNTNPPGSQTAGPVRINIRTNTGTALFCPGDYNKSGTVSVQDLFDFLQAWFGPCL